MPDKLITVDAVEPDLTPARVDERLAEGWFPWGQQWMTCRAWPMEEGPRDTIWVRVRLALRPLRDRARRLLREGCTVSVSPRAALDDEHQELYARFRASRHPEWTETAEGLLLHDDSESPMLARTRELAVRDREGRLIAYRWFLQGETAIAGIASVYDTTRDGLGGVARALSDRWAAQEGLIWSYPGYVWPGAEDTWFYKIKPGRTEWLDPKAKAWRDWDSDPPDPEDLTLAEIRRQLGNLGEVIHYPAWAVPCVNPESRGLPSPYFVAGTVEGDQLTVYVWSLSEQKYESLRVLVQPVEDGG